MTNDEIAEKIKYYSCPTTIHGDLYVKYGAVGPCTEGMVRGRLFKFGIQDDPVGAYPVWIFCGYFEESRKYFEGRKGHYMIEVIE